MPPGVAAQGRRRSLSRPGSRVGPHSLRGAVLTGAAPPTVPPSQGAEARGAWDRHPVSAESRTPAAATSAPPSALSLVAADAAAADSSIAATPPAPPPHLSESALDAAEAAGAAAAVGRVVVQSAAETRAERLRDVVAAVDDAGEEGSTPGITALARPPLSFVSLCCAPHQWRRRAERLVAGGPTTTTPSYLASQPSSAPQQAQPLLQPGAGPWPCCASTPYRSIR